MPLPTISGSVTAQGETRIISADLSQQQAAVVGATNDVIGQVSNVLSLLSTSGSSALTSAITAIDSLKAFKPSRPSFSFDIPAFVAPARETAPELVLTAPLSAPLVLPTSGLTSVDNAAFMLVPDVPNVPLPGVSTAPLVDDISAVSFTPPQEPLVAEASTPPALNYVFNGVAPASKVPTAPALRELKIPDYAPPAVPEYVAADVYAPPQTPAFTRAGDLAAPYEIPTDVIATIASWVSALDTETVSVGPALQDREAIFANTAWASRGQALPDDAAAAQQTYWADTTRLLNLAEQRRADIDTHTPRRSLGRTKLAQEQRLVAQQASVALSVLAANVDVDEAYVNTHFSLYKALASMYNAKVAEYAAEVEVYKASLDAEVSKLERWKILVDAEISKSRANGQLAQAFSAQVQAAIAQADTYATAVKAFAAQGSAYRAQMEGFAAQCESLRAKIDVYRASTEAYAAQVAGYKARFSAYAARTRVVSAENTNKKLATQISMTEIEAAGAGNRKVIAELQATGAKYRIEAARKSAVSETSRLANAIEDLKVQIAANTARDRILEWEANIKTKNTANTALGQAAQAAARYYEAASNAAFRASDQAFKAVVSSTEASSMAQQSAGKTAASIAQGAYSALHVSAGLQASGRANANEDTSGRASYFISDTISYSDAKNTTISGA